MSLSATPGRPRRAPEPLRGLDRALLAPAVGMGRRPAMARLAVVSSLADRGVAWPALAVALAPWRATRAAGGTGLAAVAATSAVTHGLKLAVRRRRPPLPLRAVARRPGRTPTTWSFPSGHTANAVAFAVGAASRRPLLGAALGPVAGAVAVTRLTTARHHPSDVAASVAIGAAVGAGVGVLTRRRARGADGQAGTVEMPTPPRVAAP